MKKFCLTFLFTAYILFVPFVMINCSVADLPYDKLVKADDPEDDADSLLSECRSQEYLTADCVSVLQGDDDRLAQEQALLSRAVAATADLVKCPEQIASQANAEETTTPASGDPETEAAVQLVDCDAAKTDTIDALTLCEQTSAANYQDECEIIADAFNRLVFDCHKLIEETFRNAETECDHIYPEESLDFCAGLSATTYDLCNDGGDEIEGVTAFDCALTDQVYKASLCECQKESPYVSTISDDVCSQVEAKNVVDEDDVETTP